ETMRIHTQTVSRITRTDQWGSHALASICRSSPRHSSFPPKVSEEKSRQKYKIFKKSNTWHNGHAGVAGHAGDQLLIDWRQSF
ncbi:hypothetical protein PIB30_063988, partial [Stylosanthes scabra]|nr:hypothetical protein [Stylosanthes scabra]